jgi:hypothetical protein
MQGKTTVTLSRLPDDSRLHGRVGTGDFLDCYAVDAEVAPRQAAEIVVRFPGWARALLLLRRVLTAPFGLSNDGPEAADKLGPFPVELETGREVIAGFDDRHLDFRVSVYAAGGRVFLATWVHPHNLGGRLYLAAIMPFHVAIARDALARVAVACRANTPFSTSPTAP